MPATVGIPAPADLRMGLLAHVPRSARHILDVGFGTGEFRLELGKRQNVEVAGLEADDEQMAAWSPEKPYDCIVCANELACLREPDRWLRLVRGWLAPEGRLIAVVPNARHHTVVGALLQGRWISDSAGAAPRSQMRFFTRREIEKLYYRAGFHIRALEAVPGPGYAEWQAQGRPAEVRVSNLHLGGLAANEAEEFYASHYLIDATPANPPGFGLTSIIILTHNQLAYTRLCVSSIQRLTDEPYELIFVDNASTDGTPNYLATLGNAKVIRNPDNRGFPAGANQGIRAAHGNQVLLLNNDTIVTTGWLGRMLRALSDDPRIGLVGPCSNNVSGKQMVRVRYDDLAQLDGFAWDWGKTYDRAVEDADRLVGFCLLARRELIDRIGLLDERFGVGCFEDDDWCRRAHRAGYRAVIARDAFVHHFGSCTFKACGVDYAALMRQNDRLYRDKWQGESREEQRPPSPTPRERVLDVRAAPGGGLLLGIEGLESSLCMIVRDNAATIGPCLESIRGVVDEMVVVDTGSKDDTPAVARHLGARVFHFPWCDSFSAARNESLRHARGKWIFWMDSDDTIDTTNASKLRELIGKAAESNIMAYVVSVHCPGPGAAEDAEVTVVQHIKLFRNFPQLRFDGRIHEQIIPAIRALNGEIGWTDLI